MRLIHRKRLICFVFVALVIFSLLSGGVGGKAYAATSLSGYSDVLDDLRKDETFNPDEYPAINDDYSLQVIQIAESTAGELYVYVYQPAANVKPLTATEMRISQSIGENIAPKDFKLSLLSRDEVFCKYLVNDLNVKSDIVRYYDIICIFRSWDSDIDNSSGNDNIIDFVQYEVAKLYTACTVNGVVTYSCEREEVVTVTDKYVARCRYLSGFVLSAYKQCDAWFVAFSTDWDMTELYDVDISYVSRTHSIVNNILGANHTYGEYVTTSVSLSREDLVSNPEYGLFSNNHTWKRIESVDEFKENEKGTLDDGILNQLQNKQWVLRFAETEFSATASTVASTSKCVEVSEVTILRLHFKSNGVVYNLGVVDDKRSGDEIVNDRKKSLWEIFIDFCKFLESVTGLNYVVWAIILLAIPLGAVLGILSIFIPPVRFVLGKIFKGIGYFFYYLCYGLFWLVSRPFVGIKAIIDKLRGN